MSSGRKSLVSFERKENKLREEKNKLREEKNKLREKENILLNTQSNNELFFQLFKFFK